MARNYPVPQGFRPGVPDSLAPVFGGQKKDYAKQSEVELFNISTALMNEVTVRDQSTGVETKHFVSAPIDADGNGIYNLPPLGESIIVPQLVADILIRKTETGYRPGEPQYGKGLKKPGMTTNAELASVVKRAFDRGISLDEAVAEYNSSALSNEMILKIARERNLLETSAAPEVIEPDNETLLRLFKERNLADLLAQDTEKSEPAEPRGPGRPAANKGGK